MKESIKKYASLVFCLLLSIAGLYLFYICGGWKECLAIFLILWGNNISLQNATNKNFTNKKTS